MVKATSLVVALTPATVPVYLTTKPLVPAPDSLLLKLKKSEPWSWPVLVIEAKGRLMTRLLVEVEMLKILPELPVETFWITELASVIWVEVPIKTFWPPEILSPVPETVKSPRLVVPMPPLLTAMTPLMPMVEVPEMAMLLPLVNKAPMSE
jgi:hypothetical protein